MNAILHYRSIKHNFQRVRRGLGPGGGINYFHKLLTALPTTILKVFLRDRRDSEQVRTFTPAADAAEALHAMSQRGDRNDLRWCMFAFRRRFRRHGAVRS